MAYLNQLLSSHDLASLSADERDFLVQRIDHVLDTHPTVREQVAAGLKTSLTSIRKDKLSLRDDSIKAAQY